MDKIKVSVIVPIYNGEKFIQKNLLILCNQTLDEIEYIFVNDHSTDKSIYILEAFKNYFKDKIKVINLEKNMGPGGARNEGIKHACGEYIGFMDQDDIVVEEMYEKLYNEAKSGDYDIVSGGYYNKEDEKYFSPLKIKGENTLDNKIKLCNNILYIWNRIYKKTLIDSMDMPFRPNTTNDDIDFCIEALLRAEKISYVNEMLYYYNFEGETYSRKNKTNVKDYINRTQNLFLSLKKRTEDVGLGEYIEKICANLAISYLRNYLLAIFSNNNFSYCDYLEFDRTAKIIFPQYYNVKKDNKDLMYVVFNMTESDTKKSFDNLVAFKNKIMNGK